MRGYKLSFLLSAVLFVAAFVAMYMEKKGAVGVPVRGSYWMFVIGAVLFSLMGQREYNQRTQK